MGKIALNKENEIGFIKMTLSQGLREDLDKWRMEVDRRCCVLGTKYFMSKV